LAALHPTGAIADVNTNVARAIARTIVEDSADRKAPAITRQGDRPPRLIFGSLAIYVGAQLRDVRRSRPCDETEHQ
jgi:hypothetical protein